MENKMFEIIKSHIEDYKEEEKEIKLNNSFKEKESTKRKLRKRINTLELENESLKETIKEELYRTFMEKLGEPQEIERLRNDNKALRKKIKTLKELMVEEHYGRDRKTSKHTSK